MVKLFRASYKNFLPFSEAENRFLNQDQIKGKCERKVDSHFKPMKITELKYNMYIRENHPKY